MIGGFPRLLARALMLGVCVVALAGCGPPQQSDTPAPTATPDPTPTPFPILPMDTPRPIASAPGVPDTPAASHRHPVYMVTWTLHGATEGTASFKDDTTGSALSGCAQAATANSSGNWVMPSQHYSSLSVGGHGIGEGVELTPADHFTGSPGTYHPGNAPIFVDTDQFNPSAFTSLTLNADGSGSLTLATYSDSSGATLDGSVTWTCAQSAG